jgi:hypothetical protein
VRYFARVEVLVLLGSLNKNLGSSIKQSCDLRFWPFH